MLTVVIRCQHRSFCRCYNGVLQCSYLVIARSVVVTVLPCYNAMLLFYRVTVQCYCSIPVSVQCYKTRIASDEERLLEALFDGYNPSARPVFNSSQAVDVRMQFSLLHIQELVRKFVNYMALRGRICTIHHAWMCQA